jgi:hypothetical protein
MVIFLVNYTYYRIAIFAILHTRLDLAFIYFTYRCQFGCRPIVMDLIIVSYTVVGGVFCIPLNIHQVQICLKRTLYIVYSSHGRWGCSCQANDSACVTVEVNVTCIKQKSKFCECVCRSFIVVEDALRWYTICPSLRVFRVRSTWMNSIAVLHWKYVLNV